MALFKRKSPATNPALATTGEAIPEGVKLAGAWAWRLLAIAAVLVVIGLLIIVLREIIVPFMVAILISALLVPVVNWLVRHRWPKALAVLVALVATLVVVAGLITLIVAQVRSGYPDLQARSLVAFEQFKTFLAGEPFFIDSKQLQDYIDQTLASVDNGTIWSGAVTVSTTAGHFLVGLLLTIFATIFILIDGKGIWNWIVRIFPRRARPAIDGSGKAGWLTLTTFVKVQIFVAFVDAVGIGLGAFILGLFYRDQGGFPLVIPIAIAVFLGSFIPVVGAVVTGIFAVFVALVFLGPVPAIIMLGIVLLVQQVEGHILQPLVMGSAVKVHPLAVVFAVAAGSGIAGIVGALFAVPVVAVANVMVTYIASGKWRTQSRPLKKDVVSQV
ncbi:AI-2E family transporter [Glaciihabitans arcticus]|uniref:AI-2E family transporter n=1 Tax=Glaciihabitans arcticus TaxID=2668039 RepID=UPI001F00DAD3|nr:AI-2E family transporter [Glaciihabitans arcticus]